MKKILSIFALSLGMFSLTGCSDFLDQKSPSELSDEAVWSSPYYTQLRVNRLYGQLTNDRSYSQDLSIVWNMNSDIELVDGLGDNAYNTSSERGAMNYNLTPGWSKIGDVWSMLYSIIEDANLNIEGIRGSSLIKGGGAKQTEMEQYLGESLTLRAMIYFDLVRYFGDVPFKIETSKSDLSNAYTGKTDRDIIMDQLIKDLEEAVNYLPWAGEGISTEHVNKGYAHALIAQIAMTKAGYAIRETAKDGYETASYSDPTYPTQRPDAATRKALFEKAQEHLAAIIKYGKHNLNASFRTEWYNLNQRQLDVNCYENLFEIPMGLNVSGELGYTVGVRMNGVTSEYGYGNSSGKMKLTANLLYMYEEDDQRRDLTVAPFEITQDDDKKATVEKMLENVPFGLYVGKWDPRMMSKAWLDENKVASAKHMTGINPVKCRYSNVLLWFAEVMNELYGPTTTDANCGLSAYDALAKVHNRAFATPQDGNDCLTNAKASQDAMFEAIVEENAMEFAGEGFRKWDLIRWNLLVEKIREAKKEYLTMMNDGTFQKEVYFNYIKDDAGQPTNKIDFSSITWYGLPAGKTADDYHASAKSFGNGDTSKNTDTQVYTNLPSISSGLVGVGTLAAGGTTINFEEPAIMNRYLLPIASTTISASNGAISNSYGYTN